MTRLLRPALLAVLAFLVASCAARAQDASELIVRLNRLEGQLRQMSGQVEQLQFENRSLKDQFRKFQEDVEFRFQERGGRAASPAPASPSAQPARPARRSDAYDPAADPTAPGAPRTLGAAPPASPAAPPGRRDPIAGLLEEDSDEAPPGRRPLDLGAAAGRPGSADAVRPPSAGRNPGAAEALTAERGPSVASTGDPRSDYDVAYAFLIQRQYDRAEAGFRGYLQSHPRDRLVPDATYWLGESYLQRSRPREAAEQFLKVSTEYSRSAKAPDALLKLGVSLAALGAKDQACATFAELERKFPTASPSIKQGIDREQKRVRCSA